MVNDYLKNIFIAFGGGMGYICGYMYKRKILTQEKTTEFSIMFHKNKHFEILFTIYGIITGGFLYKLIN